MYIQSNKGNHLSNSLKGIRFFKMPDIPYDILFHRQSIINDCCVEDKIIRAPLALGRRAFLPEIDSIEYAQNPTASVLMLLSDPVRKSNEINFNKVVSTVKAPDTIIVRRCRGKLSIEGFFLFFVLLPIWMLQMKNRKLRAVEKYQVLKGLVETYYYQKYYRNIDVKRYKLLICYYDSVLPECILNLMCKKAGVRTATLQHGQFNAWRENTIANCGLEFFSSPSDYHLCWNKFAQEEAIKCGWEKDRLPIVGIMSNIGRGIEICNSTKNGVFGVVISHPYWEHENFEMIKAANLLSERYDMGYYLKLHPIYEEDYFKKLVNQHFLGIVTKGIDTLDYCNMVEFTIVGSTSFFVEMVYCHHDILRYSSQQPSDKYKDIKLGNVFHRSEDVISCYENMSDNSKDVLFDYLCETNDTYSSYKETIHKLCIMV